ncbi:serine/threonine protein kinase [Paenibacillus sp. JX-17]|uniref:Serine/threonine protein kinase n=1 Tax=Paenibacillus lacisoli TaxID=3064525 RepID=A0ABT9CH49_9BACL|nr:serine/threonine protein kinase [Paenibacillus sp. JX-17]MDO7908587.1 serine/threonine protein kinase [Paenibacillus sp. JX-17]
MTTSSNPGFPPGTVIKGKWKAGRYMIRRILGRGANGTVYLVQQAKDGRELALKMGNDPVDLQSEINVLTSLQIQGASASLLRDGESYLLDVDDFTAGGQDIPFYVMRYVRGEPLHRYVARHGSAGYAAAGLQILERLSELHQSGWIFGDLKPQNVLVSVRGTAELIDYGGVSRMGRSVKQFTEWYDRGFWNAGGRHADVQYDLFAFALLTIHVLESPMLKHAASKLPQLRNITDIHAIIRRSEKLKPYAAWLNRAVNGDFKDARRAAESWNGQVFTAVRRRASQRRTPRWLRNAFAASLVLLVGAVWLALRP